MSQNFTELGREFGLFLEGKFSLGNIGLKPSLAVTSGDGTNSFGENSIDNDQGGFKYGGRMNIYPLGFFKTNNELVGHDVLKEKNVNMVTCGGQATIPMVAAVNKVSSVKYAEIVASVSSRSAGPGTRANIDEFTQTTKLGLEKVGGADRAKAIIVLNPAEPPLLMRNTVFTLCDPVDQQLVKDSVEDMVERVQSYVPGYRLKQEVQFERFGSNNPCLIPGYGEFEGLKASIFLEVEGAGHYLPTYAGNLDIMTSAAMGTAQELIKLNS